VSKNHIFDALGKAASDIPSKLGESLSTVQRFDTPLEQATTPSLEALKAFSSGVKGWSTSKCCAPIPVSLVNFLLYFFGSGTGLRSVTAFCSSATAELEIS
jgi:hypothetical protein